MSGTTTNYAFPYPTSTDLVKNGATAIQSLADGVDAFISGSSASGKLFYIAADSTNSTVRTTSAATWTTSPTGGSHAITFTTGKSGVFAIWLKVTMLNATAANRCDASITVSGATTFTESLYKGVSITSGARQSAGYLYLFDGTASTSTTVTLSMQSPSGTQLSMVDSTLTAICLG